jgi:energy-coupling factor transporter ATP-binding protein EcfA2
MWTTSARPQAEQTVDPRVVSIFYEGLEPAKVDFQRIRDAILPLPAADLDYRAVLLLGTTGAGKTTLVRQILGTNPLTERFPSTSAAKTTIADTELIFSQDPEFRAVVTFVGRDEVYDYLSECVAEAAIATHQKAELSEVRRRLLDHPNQRFRFSYVLGRGYAVDADVDEDDDVDDDAAADEELDLTDVEKMDLAATASVINEALATIKDLVAEYEAWIRQEFSGEKDERVLDELIEDTLDSELRGDERFHRIVDDLFEEVEKRFDLLVTGDVQRSHQGWPVAWSWHSTDRAALLKAVTRFSSNYARLFGTLLTPLVNGIRVAGPFHPEWLDGEPLRLVLIDGEGLGHSPNSAAALSTSVSKRVAEVDAVLLVDNATQPMQAAPVAAMKAVVTSGNAGKLLFCFTHFDLVTGPNLRTFSDREDHVRASGENVLKAIGEDLGPFAERILRQRLSRACFFVGGIDGTLDSEKKAGRRSIEQFRILLQALDAIVERPAAAAVRPVYDRANLVLAVREAAEGFHDLWWARLGFEQNPQIPKEHWTRIKALSRRFAEGWDNEYDRLKPVAELERELEEQIYRMLQRPLRWEGGEPTDDEKQQVFDQFASSIAKEARDMAGRRIDDDRRSAWRDAFAKSGSGSTFVRARIIASEVYARAAPVPGVTPSPDQNSFLHDVAELVDGVAAEQGIEVV